MEKRCKACHRLKDIIFFINSKGDELKNCNICLEKARLRSKEYHEKHKEERNKKRRVYSRKYYSENKEKEKIRNKEYLRNNIERIRDRQKKYRELNRDHTKKRVREYYLKNIDEEKRKKKRYLTSPAKYANQFFKLTVEEDALCGDKGQLLVRCAYCRSYFCPTNAQVYERIRSLEGRSTGECRLYCSQECKDSCEVYRVRVDPYARHASVERNSSWAKQIKKSAKYTCERCGSKENLEAHHEIPVKVDQSLVNDETNGICLCHECHMKAHSESGCTLADLRKI